MGTIRKTHAEKAFDIAVNRAESFIFKSAEQRYLELIQMQPDIIDNIPLYQFLLISVLQAPLSVVYEKEFPANERF